MASTGFSLEDTQTLTEPKIKIVENQLPALSSYSIGA